MVLYHFIAFPSSSDTPNIIMATETPPTTSTDPPATAVGRSRALRTLLVAIGLLAVATLGGPVIIQGWRALQSALGLGDGFALTYLVGGGLATLWFAIVGYAYLRVHPVEISYDLRWPTRRDLGWVLGGAVAIVAAALLIDVGGRALGAVTPTTISAAAAVENPVVIYAVFLVGNLVFIAPVEEFLFRGVIQGRLRESFGPGLAIGVTAVGFGLGHLASYWFGGSDLLALGVWVAILSIAVTGAILGVFYERTRSLLLVSLLHGLLNTVGIGIALAAML